MLTTNHKSYVRSSGQLVDNNDTEYLTDVRQNEI